MNIPPKYEDVVAQLEASNKLCESLERSMKNHRHELGLSQGREAALREELIEKEKTWTARFELICEGAIRPIVLERNEAQQRLTVAEQRADQMTNALARIQGRAEMFIDDGMHMPTPSIEVIRDIAVKAALKPAEEGEGK